MCTCATRMSGRWCHPVVEAAGPMHACICPPMIFIFGKLRRTEQSGWVLVNVSLTLMGERADGLRLVQRNMHTCMFLKTIKEPCIRVIVAKSDPDYMIFGMVPRGEDPNRRLSLAKLKTLFPCFFRDDGTEREQPPTIRRRPANPDEVLLDDLPLAMLIPQDEFPPRRMVIPQDEVVLDAQIDGDDDTDHGLGECVVCMRPFSRTRIRLCLPCQDDNGNLTRHCQMCQKCLNFMISEQVKPEAHGVVQCPICRHTYTIQMLQDAMDFGCLSYPQDLPSAETVQGWHGRESAQKKRCVKSLSHESHPFDDQPFFERKARAQRQIEQLDQVVAQNDGVRMVVTPSDYFQRLGGVMQARHPGHILNNICPDHRNRRSLR